MKNGFGRGEMIDYWYLSEGWMLGRRVSPLGELAKPPQLHNSGRHLIFLFHPDTRKTSF